MAYCRSYMIPYAHDLYHCGPYQCNKPFHSFSSPRKEAILFSSTSKRVSKGSNFSDKCDDELGLLVKPTLLWSLISGSFELGSSSISSWWFWSISMRKSVREASSLPFILFEGLGLELRLSHPFLTKILPYWAALTLLGLGASGATWICLLFSA